MGGNVKRVEVPVVTGFIRAAGMVGGIGGGFLKNFIYLLVMQFGSLLGR